MYVVFGTPASCWPISNPPEHSILLRTVWSKHCYGEKSCLLNWSSCWWKIHCHCHYPVTRVSHQLRTHSRVHYASRIETP